VITRIKGNQIFDGTITSANIDDTLEKEFTKVRITTDDTTPNFLYSKIDTSGSIEINVVGAAGTSQILAITGSGAPFAGGNGNDNNLITTDGNGNLIAEPNFNFNGSILNLTGSAKITGSYIHVSSGSLEYTPAQGWSSSLLRVQKYITTSDYNDGHNVAAIISIKSTALDGGVIGSRSEVINSQTTNGGIGIYGSTSTAIHASTSNNTTFLVGSSGETVLSSSTGETLGNLQTAYGTLGGVGFHGTVGAGSITNAYALYAFKTGVGASTTITTAKGLQVTNMGGTGVTNAIGVDISSQTGAATLNLGLRTQSPVVIGTTNVAGTEKLRVNGTSYFDDSAAFTLGLSGSLTKLTDGTSYLIAGDGISITSASNGAITITGNVGDITSVTAGTGLLGGGTSSDVTLSINDSVVATISGSRFTGNVGIKKTGTLSSPLHVSGSADASTSPTIEIEGAWVSLGDRDFKTQTFNNGIGIKFNDTNVVHYSIGQIGGNFTIAQTSADGTVLFNSDRLEILTANQSGRTAFGTSPTSARVIISGSIASDTTLLVRHGHATGASLPVLNVQNSIGTSLLYVSGSGDVGIGTTSPTSKLHVVGTVYANSLSGSLTRLSNNTSYLVAGGDISIVSSSNGQVTISSTTGKYFNSTTAGSIFTTGSAAFVGGVEAIDSPLDKGPDVFFYVSGSKDSKGTAIPGTAVFGGDVVISGTLHGGSPLKVGGGLIMTDGTLLLDTPDSIIRANEISGSLTRLLDNTSYLVAGSNISIVTGSQGNVTIETYAPGENTQMLFNNNGIIDSSENLSYNIDTSILALTGTLGMNGNIVPDSDVTYDLGSASKRWANIYTGDLHLKNDRGDWTLIEEEAFLSIRNNKTGKRFKINMEPVPELDD